MKTSLMGMETEYALTGPESNDILAYKVNEILKKRNRFLPSTASCDNDIFLSAGFRSYVDCTHPEISTPECSNPTELVRYLRAGDLLLEEALEEFNRKKTIKNRAMIFRCNVDYSGRNTTWGSHESYLHKQNPENFIQELIPHLVTRIVYSGAGGFNPLSPGALEFTLSPRVWHLDSDISPKSTSRRGIFHLKNEQLSNTGTHRLHLICGESLCSDIANWLRVGTTALVVALVDSGLKPGKGVSIKSPIRALREISTDPNCLTPIKLVDDREVTAIDIQRHYLNQVESQLNKDTLPEWAGKVCKHWRSMLDRIPKGPEAISDTLDWAIKYIIYKDYIEKNDFKWSELESWNTITSKIYIALRKNEYKGKVSADLFLNGNNPISDTINQLTPFMKRKALSWDKFDLFLKLRKKLFEIDTRFGQIGKDGIFNFLDREGLLQHKVANIGSIKRAKTHPPSFGRARLRGEAIKRYSGQSGYHCYWDGIHDFNGKRFLDLNDPFSSEVVWKDINKKYLDDERHLRQMLRLRRNPVIENADSD